jgi:hypothetical protein
MAKNYILATPIPFAVIIPFNALFSTNLKALQLSKNAKKVKLFFITYDFAKCPIYMSRDTGQKKLVT